MADFADSATSRLGELLRYPDDLLKIPALRESIARDKAAIDLQLKSGVQSQLEITTNGLRNLRHSQDLMESLKEQIMAIDRQCANADSMIPNFSQIHKISTVRRNFRAVDEIIQKLKDLPDKIRHIEELMEQDGRNTFDPMPNFLAIHYHLYQLHDFRDRALNQAKESSEDAVRTLSNYFGRLNDLLEEFDAIVMDIGQELLEILREGNSSLIVRLAKVIEIEERRDEQNKLLETAVSSHRRIATHISTGSGDNYPMSSTKSRNYNEKLTEAINLSAKDIFKNCVAAYPDDPESLLDNLYWVFRDLLLAKTELSKCFSSKWKIPDRFVRAYHAEMYSLLNSLATEDVEAGVLLRLVRWSQKYYDTMTTELKVSPELLTPALLDGKENEILDEYMDLICRKIGEWMSNLGRTEYKEFINREQAPDEDPDRMYGLSSTPIVFQMLNQQVSVAIDSDRISVLRGVIVECKKQLVSRQQQWLKIVRDEIARSNSGTEEVPGGLVEYIIALANDQVRGADYTDGIASRQVNVSAEVLIHSDKDRELQQEMIRVLEETMDGFIATGKSCVQETVGMVLYDLQPVFSALFTKAWYSATKATTTADGSMMAEPASKLVEEMVNTFEEYNNVLRHHLNPDLYQIYIDELLDGTLVQYLSAIGKNKGAKFSSRAIDQIKNDVAILYPFFSEFTDDEHVQAQFAAVEAFLALVASDRAGVAEEYTALLKSFPDAPVRFVEDIIRARDDLDARAYKDFVDTAKTAATLFEAEHNIVERRTIFSEIYSL
ncbi:exocyst complex component Sec6-domain-containing protein [Dipodascopsis tothii]|uniref:exocyst complex component Sec6-domain-containing protein n=1 Tax=Dipodascopsis tothii TaxID=44089 RepID=UPI0034CE592C